MSHLWGDEDPLHVQNEPTCPTCCNPMNRHWLHAHEWECEGCDLEETNEAAMEDAKEG